MTELTFHYREQAQKARQLKREARIKLAWDYGTSLEHAPEGLFHDETILPAAKLEIIHSLLYMIANAETKQLADLFTAALYTLAYYHKEVGESIGVPEGDQENVLNLPPDDSVEIMKAYPFGRVKQLSALAQSDQQRMDRAVKAALAANVLLVPWHTRVRHFFTGQGRYHTAYCGTVDFMLDQ